MNKSKTIKPFSFGALLVLALVLGSVPEVYGQAYGTMYGAVYPNGNINSGNPAHPFGEYLKLPNGIIAQPEGVSNSDMNAMWQKYYSLYVGSVVEYTGETVSGIPLIANFALNNGGNNHHALTESMGYSMLIAASFADKNLFDGLWMYVKTHMIMQNNPCDGFVAYLPAWETSMTSPFGITGCDSAGDGDEDIAMALLMACKQWPSTGIINYCGEAQTMIQAMLDIGTVPASSPAQPWYRDVDMWNYYTSGDTFNVNGISNSVYVDYWAPGYYRCWGSTYSGVSYPNRGTTGADWTNVANNTANALVIADAAAGNHGFNSDNLGMTGATGTTPPTGFSYSGPTASAEGMRGPLRYVEDVVFNGNNTLANFIQNTNTSFKTGGATSNINLANRVWNITQGWNTNGTFSGLVGQWTMGTLAAVATGSGDQTWVNQAYRLASTYQLAQQGAGTPYAPTSLIYYNNDFDMLGLLINTGNFPWPCDNQWNQAVMKVSMDVDRTFGCPGQTMNYTLVYKNVGAATATGVVLKDTLPPNASYVTSSPAGTNGGSVVTWNIGNVAPNTPATVTIQLQISNSATSGQTVINQVEADPSNGVTGVATAYPENTSPTYRMNYVDVVNCALQIVKSVNKPVVNPGDTVTYTLNYANNSTERLGRTRPQVFVWYTSQSAQSPANPAASNFFETDYMVLNESYEDINLKNYRVSYFLNDASAGVNACGSTGNNFAPQTIYDTSGGYTYQNLPMVPGTGYNQKIVMQWGGNVPNMASTLLMDRYLIQQWNGWGGQVQTQVHWFRTGNRNDTTDWSYSTVTASPCAAYGSQPNLGYAPIKTDLTDPGGYADPCHQAGTNAVTNLLVEEYDGSTWRVVAGNAPYYGRDVNAQLSDTLNSNLTFGGFVGAPCDAVTAFNSGTNTATWTWPDLKATESGTVTYWAIVKSNAATCSTIPNQATLDDLNGLEKTATSNSVPVSVACTPVPTPTATQGEIVKTANPTSVTSGSNITYTLVYTNQNPGLFNGNFGSGSMSGWVTAAGSMALSNWGVAGGYLSLNSYGNSGVVNQGAYGTNGTLNFTMYQPAYQPSGAILRQNGNSFYYVWINGNTYPNPAQIALLYTTNGGSSFTTVGGAGGVGSFVAPNNGTSGTTGPINVQVTMNGSNFTIQVSTNGGPYNTVVSQTDATIAGPGYAGVYATSSGTQYSVFTLTTDWNTQVVITDTVPTGETFVSATNGGVNIPPVVWNVGNLAPGASVTETLVAKVTAGNGTVIPNTASMSSPSHPLETSLVANVTVGGVAATNTYTYTPSPSPTNSPTRTPTLTPTYSPTNSPTLTPSATLTVTSTMTRTNTPTLTSTVTPSSTASPTQTLAFTATSTFTPSPTTTPTATSTRTSTATSSMTPTATLTATPTSTPTLSSTPTITSTWTTSPTGTQPATNTYTVTLSPTVTSTFTLSPTRTWTATSTSTPTATWTSTASWTQTWTPSPTASFTPTQTYTWTQTPLFTYTRTYTPTLTATPQFSFTWTSTVTSTRTPTVTVTSTPTSPTVLVSQPTGAQSGQSVLSGSSAVTQTQFTLTAPTGLPVTFTKVVLTDTGTGNPSGIGAVRILRNGVVVASGTFTGVQATLSLNEVLNGSGPVTYVVEVDYTASATGTYQIGVTANTDFTGVNRNNGQPAIFTGAPVIGSVVVVSPPTPTSTRTPTPTPTSTWTWTPTFTSTRTASPTPSATETASPTPTYTLIWTWTPSLTPTATNTPASFLFFVDKNLFHPPQEPVSIHVGVNAYPGEYSLRIYNTAGELVRHLDEKSLTQPFAYAYAWDGTNDQHEMCSSGVYIIYLIEPFQRRIAKVMLVH